MRLHDEVAVPMVLKEWEKHGFSAHVLGTESDDEALRAALATKADTASLLLRFRPDRVLIRGGTPSVLCEVKSNINPKHHNFAVEVQSYWAATHGNDGGSQTCFALIDLPTESILACWANELPTPRRIRVPDRWDHQDTIAWLRGKFPLADFDIVDYEPIRRGGGSGTSFFLVSQSSRVLVPLDCFIRERVLGEAPLPSASVQRLAETHSTPARPNFDNLKHCPKCGAPYPWQMRGPCWGCGFSRKAETSP